jgi:methanogenic corrinoid protein MtbC1
MTSARFAANLLRHGARACASAAIEAMQQASPQLVAGVPRTFAEPVDDTHTRLLTLAEALDVDRPALLAEQTAWYKVALAHRGVDADYLRANLHAIDAALREALPAACHPHVARHLAAAIARLEHAPTELPSLLEGPGPLRDEARRFLLALLENRRAEAIELVLAAHRAGARVEDLHDHVLALAQREIGRMWLMAEIPVADEHYASRAVETCLDRLAAQTPRPAPNGRTVLTFAVGGDQHAIGVRLVAERLERNGFGVWDLGADMPANDLPWLLHDRRVDLIALGATLVLHVGSARASIAALREALGANCPPILVGGHPFAVVPDLHEVLGADAVATDPATAVARARELLALP